MSASRDKAANGSTRRPPREALERWLAEAGALLAAGGQAAVAQPRPAS